MLLLLVPIGLATVLGLFLLWPDGESTRAQQVAEIYLPPGTTYADARVVSVEPYDCSLDETPRPHLPSPELRDNSTRSAQSRTSDCKCATRPGRAGWL